MQLSKSRGGNLKLGANRFADQLPQEIQSLLKYKPHVPASRQPLSDGHPSPMLATNNTFDWRDKGRVTAVKDQMYCGASWAYATASALESSWIALQQQNVTLSIQQLIDCVPGVVPPRGCETALSMKNVSDYVTFPYQVIQTD